MNKSTATRVRLSPKERAALELAAASWGSTLSDALRWAIRAQYMGLTDPPTKNEGSAVFVQSTGAPLGVTA